MKALLINGSPREKGCTYTALKLFADTLAQEGIDSEILYLGTKPIAGCIACGYCYEHDRCVLNEDAVNQIIARLNEFDAIVLGSPVYYAGPSGQLTAFCDRLFYAGNGFEGKLGAAIVSCRRGGASAAFDRLNKYFTISRMPIVSSQYWNQVHGNTPEEVREDGEGLQTVRTLAREMAWLLKCIEAGKKAGVERPVKEKRIATNFIR